jgi:hypothetical protein
MACAAIKVYHGDLYAGILRDTLTDGTVINYIARWDEQHWQPLGAGVNYEVNAMEVYHDTLWVAGGFTTAGGDSAIGLARWYMPDTNCNYLKQTIHTLADTFDISGGPVNVQFYNNNSYADSWHWDFGDSGTASTEDPSHIYTDTGTYTVTVTVTDSTCIKTATATIVIVDYTGFCNNTTEHAGMKIYPNPTDSGFTIELSGNISDGDKAELKVFKLSGGLEATRKVEKGETRIDLSTAGWRKGAYIVGLYNGNKLLKAERVEVK